MIFFDLFQLVTLVAFLTVFIGRSIWLYRQHGINPLVLGVGKTGFRRFVELAFFVGLLLWIIEIGAYALHLDFRIFGGAGTRVLLDHVAAKVSGVVLIGVGFGFFVLALLAFGRSWRVGIDERAPGALVTQGVFAYSRNPIFLFIDLYFVGTFLINGSVFFFVAALIVLAGMHYQILQEETFLRRHYGAAYQIYFNSSGRYFSWRRARSQG